MKLPRDPAVLMRDGAPVSIGSYDDLIAAGLLLNTRGTGHKYAVVRLANPTILEIGVFLEIGR